MMNFFLRLAPFFLLAVFITSSCATHRSPLPERSAKPNRPEPATWTADVRFLSDSEQQGRGLGTAGIERSADWIETQFRAAGLTPVFKGGAYSRTFSAMVGAREGTETALSLDGQELKHGRQFRVFGLSSPALVTAPVVFAGYGITAPEHQYDDYAGIDVLGKYVLLLRYEPISGDTFEGKEWSEHATFRSKIFNARRHGAAGVLLVNGPRDKPGAHGDELVPIQSDPLAGAGFGIPAFHLARSAVEPFLERSDLDLGAFQKQVDAELHPASRPLAFQAAGHADIHRLSLPVRNVAAYLAGADESRVIVLGAHYDHLGFGGPYRVTGPTDSIHHGADDNASGTAAMLALARHYGSLAAMGKRPPVSLLFVAFSGEESGLVGSTQFVQQLPISKDRIVVMLNFDMIGRMTDQRLQIFGTGSALELPALVAASIPAGIKAEYHPSGFGPSDHAPFYAAGIPVLHFWTGPHVQYHTPADTVDLLNAEGALAVIETAQNIIDGLFTVPRLTYQPPERPQLLHTAEGEHGRPLLGISPSFTANFPGVVIAAILPDTPAAGILEPGDRILTINDHRVLNFYELSYRLRGIPPGGEVNIGFSRGGEVKQVRVRLGGGR